MHVDLHPTNSSCRRIRTALARSNASDTVVAEEEGKAVWEGRQAGWRGGKVGWLAGSGPGGGPGGVAGKVGWRAW